MTVTWYDSTDTLITAAISLSAEQGNVGSAVEIRAWNNRSGVGADTRQDLYLEVLEVVAGVPKSSGTEALDQYHVQARVVSGLNQTVQASGWVAIGAARWLEVPPLANDTGVKLEVRLAPPAHATSTSVTVRFHLISRSTRPIPLGLSRRAGDAIFHGIGDGSYSALASFDGLAENGTPDDQVAIGRLEWVYEGVFHALASHLVTLDDTDGSAATLGAGEAYIAVLTAAAGTITITKGDKGATPTAPSAPADELLLGEVLREFDGLIHDADITEQYTLGFFAFDSAALTAQIGPGDGLVLDQVIHHDGISTATLVDDDTNELFLMPDGSLGVTTDGSKPDPNALLIWEPTTASGVVTGTVDRRLFAPVEEREILISTGSPVAVNDERQSASVHNRPWCLLPVVPVSLWLHDAGSGLSSGVTRVDIEYSDNGGSWTSLFAADADMPQVAYNDSTLVDHSAKPTVVAIPARSRLRARVDAVPTGTTAPSGITVILKGWPC